MNKSSEFMCHTRHIVLLIFIVIIVPYFSAPAFSQQEAPTVVVGKAEQVDLIEEIPLSGTVISPRIANLSTEVSGIIEAMEVDIGSRVRTGDEILRLNSELISFSLEAARAITLQATVELNDAKRRMEDVRSLAKRQTISANELESLAAEVRINDATVKRFHAEEQNLTAQLRRHKLSAPFDGVISKKMVEVGEWIQPGQAVVELVATSGLRIDFQVPQTVYTKLDQVTDVLINMEGLPDQTFIGNIETIIPVNDPTTRTFLIRVALNESDINLAPGMSASALLRLRAGQQGIAVPRDALTRYPDNRITLWVVNNNSETTTVSERLVQTGLSFDGMITITSGLEADTPVVIQGNEALRDGQAITVLHNE